MMKDMKKRVLYAELFNETNQELKEAFSQVKDEFEDHLHAINANTNEIQSNHEFLVGIDQKIGKVEERLDRITMFLERHGMEPEQQHVFDVEKLTKREQEVFLVLYTQEEAKGSVTYLDMAHHTGLTEDLVANYVANMIAKGVPIRKSYLHNQAHFALNPHFKAMQAKENVLGIEQQTLVV
tara:strand:+ start:131 stop:673 length:543 start_codon:yes stop_codon:yes gene_type:complete